jgi:hypothetical protein
MKRTIISLLVVSLCMGLPFVSFAQVSPLKNRSALEVNIGFWGGAGAANTISFAGIRSEAKTNGFSGGMLYSYWMQENLSFTIGAGLLAGEASSSVGLQGIVQRSSIVIPLLIGLKYNFLNHVPDDVVRPFLSAAVGPYIGMEAKSTVLSQEAFTETAIGGHIGAGADFFLGRHFKLGVNMGYNLISDFGNPVGARKNYSGAEFSLGPGYIF